MGTIIVLVIVAGLFSLAFAKTIKQRKQGGCSGCSGCQAKGSCQDYKE